MWICISLDLCKKPSHNIIIQLKQACEVSKANVLMRGKHAVKNLPRMVNKRGRTLAPDSRLQLFLLPGITSLSNRRVNKLDPQKPSVRTKHRTSAKLIVCPQKAPQENNHKNHDAFKLFSNF